MFLYPRSFDGELAVANRAMSSRGTMTDSVDKSCWGITLWTVAIVVGAILAASLFTAPEQAATMVNTVSTS